MTHSNERPARIEKLGHSTFAYNYNVKEVVVEDRIEFQYETLVFGHVPTRNEVINRIICETYPDGEESAIQRKGIIDNHNQEFVEYNNFVEYTKAAVKQDFEQHETIQ